jgi:RimJ/RimL family protein N-acetyltransferase
VTATVPGEIHTARLTLRPWRAEDAALLEPVLATNWEHLGPWIPRRIAEHAPVPVLAQRLAGFAAEFAADREWRYGMFSKDERTVFGEVALFPRVESGRVQYADADRAELGYWLRADMTGQGFVTEAARDVLAVAAKLPHVSHIEIRCDARNLSSSAVPRRLGFTLAGTIPAFSQSSGDLQVWVSECSVLEGG